MSEAIWITEADVVNCVDLIDAIDAVAHGFLAESRGGASAMAKTHARWNGPNTLHALGAVAPEWQLVGTKTWAHTEGGACPLLLLFDANDGSLRAVIEAFALGQLRTAAVSGVATRAMAPAGATRLAQIGTGKQALAQVGAVLAVRPIETIFVYSPTEAKRKSFAEKVAKEFQVEVVVCDTADAALIGSDIATVATRATEPFITLPMLTRVRHINAIGAITPERAEIHRDVLSSASLIVADTVDAACRLSREYSEFSQSFPDRSIHSLASVLSMPARAPLSGLTMFKAMGIGLADLAVGQLVFERVRRMNGGLKISQPLRQSPRLWRNY